MVKRRRSGQPDVAAAGTEPARVVGPDGSPVVVRETPGPEGDSAGQPLDRDGRAIGFRRPSAGRAAHDVPARPFEALAVMVGPHRLAIPTERIRAILPYRTPSSVPLAPPSIEGILDHEGDVIAVVDLRARLGLPPTGPDRLTRLIVVGGDEEAAALRVDATGEQALVDAAAFDRPPGLAVTPGAAFIRGVVRLPNGLALLADVDDLVEVPG
jgi:purine-binding chemotaxis protein CheW